MIPNADQLELIAQMSKGDLAETPYPILLHALAAHRRSAVVVIERRQLKKKIILESGMAVDCSSNLLQDTLGKFMVNRGDITEEQCQLALSRAATTGRAIGDVLVAQGLVSAEELYKIMQENLAKKLLDGFTWRSGDFRVSGVAPRVDSPLKVKTPQLILTGVTKLVSDEEIEKAVAPLAEKRLFVNPRPPYSPGEIRLSGEHHRIVEILRGGNRIKAVESETGMAPELVRRLLYSLAVVGIVITEEWLPADRVMASPDVDFMLPMPEPLPPAAEAAMVPPEELRNQLMEAYLRYRRQDAFELLGVSEDASVEEMEQKYLEFSENYAPGKFKPSGVSELADKARDLFLAGARAFGELIDPDRREALITRRQEMALDRTNRFTRDQLFERPELLDPETHFNEGRALMKSGKHSQAIARLQFAHDWDPQNSLYRAELAYCRYLADPAGQALESIRELREALRIDPGCGLAFFYAGLIHGEIGNYIEAEVYLHKAAALLRSDTRPTEALESLEIAKERGRKSRPS